MKRTEFATMLIAAGLAWISGCNGQTETIDASSGAPRQVRPATELVAQSRPPIPDLPVPIGFKLDQGKSRDYAPGGARFVDHTYKGSGAKLAVKRFYERQMPINRWVCTMAMFVRGDITLDFEKESERCLIVITHGSLFHPTTIKVQMWTRGQIETPATK